MKTLTGLAIGALGALTVTFGTAPGAGAQDFDWPRLMVIATPGTSTGSFASTNGWAPVLQKETGTTVRVVPEDSELKRYLRLTDDKNVAVASISAAEMRFQLQGIGAYASAKPGAMRLLWHHNDTPWGYVVAGNSKIQSMDDLKAGGVRISQSVASPAMTLSVKTSLPAYLGMSPEEAEKMFEYVPASSYGASCRAVTEGKADIAYCAPISSVLSEMEGSPGGIRWIDMPVSNKEGWEGYLASRPMLAPGPITLGVETARGVGGLTSNFVYTVSADADEDFAYNMAKWLDQSYDNYKSSHALAARMSRELFRSYLNVTPLPVHEGVVRYLREAGVWTDEDDVWNAEAVALMDRWVAAREAAFAEAREKGVKIDAQNPDFLAIVETHTAGLPQFRSRL